jgi:hypothetical protein
LAIREADLVPLYIQNSKITIIHHL